MNRKHVAGILALSTVVWFGVFTAAAHGQPADQSAQQDIENALSQKDTFDFADVSLSSFVSTLRDKYGVNVVIDYRALGEKEIGADSPLSIKLKDVTVRSALELAIRPLGLSWTIYCEAIVISTPAAIQNMQFTKVYDITELATVSDGQGKTSEEPEALADLITSAVAPESWNGAGGRGTIQLVSTGPARLLVVSQDYRLQRQIERLLTELQAAVKRHAPAKATRGEGPVMRPSAPDRQE
ncbi:MAG: hypothetical protein ABSE63_04185 [Thermoguttaceae bacterium]|jgi:type II secretory pathway component GspD/PulD (secretin)